MNSKSWNLAAVAIAFSSKMNSLLTLIRSNALGFASAVLSPNNTVPWPGKDTTGLIRAGYRISLCALVGLNASLTAPRICPLLKPPGEKNGSATVSVFAHRPAISPFSGTNLNTSLNLSN